MCSANTCARRGTMSFNWYHRSGLDPWQMSACETHGAELVALGFFRGVSPLLQAASVADRCVFCQGSTSIAEARACRCNTFDVACPVPRQQSTRRSRHAPRGKRVHVGAAGHVVWVQLQSREQAQRVVRSLRRIAGGAPRRQGPAAQRRVRADGLRADTPDGSAQGAHPRRL
jgi:hypothetical protein